MRNSQVRILSAFDNVSQSGGQFDVGQIVSASFQVLTGGVTASGTVQLQAYNGPVVGPRNLFVPPVGSWSNIPAASSVVASGVGPVIVIPNMCFSYLRAIYTLASGGSGTELITVDMNTLSI